MGVFFVDSDAELWKLVTAWKVHTNRIQLTTCVKRCGCFSRLDSRSDLTTIHKFHIQIQDAYRIYMCEFKNYKYVFIRKHLTIMCSFCTYFTTPSKPPSLFSSLLLLHVRVRMTYAGSCSGIELSPFAGSPSPRHLTYAVIFAVMCMAY